MFLVVRNSSGFVQNDIYNSGCGGGGGKNVIIIFNIIIINNCFILVIKNAVRIPIFLRNYLI
jgi:hypothetical protein